MRRPTPVFLLPVLAALALAGALPEAAHADFVAGEVIDGPSADIERLGDVQLARDGTGAIAWVKGGGILVSRFVDGAFQPAEQLNTGLGRGTDVVVGAADGGRLAVVFSSGGTVYGVARPARAAYLAPVALGAGDLPSVDVSINGTGYASFTQGSDVRLSRLDRRSNAWETLPTPVDVDPAREAGTGSMRSSVATSADGIGIVAWGERVGGATRVFARKVFGSRLSAAPQDLTVATLAGQAGGDADMPQVAAQDDSSFAIVAFRQAFPGHPTRTVFRRQRGTAFDDAQAVDAGGEGATTPRVDINGRGEGLFGSSGEGSRQPMAAALRLRELAAPQRVGSPAPQDPFATPVIGETNRGFVLWSQGGGVVRARAYDDARPGAEVTVSRPELGPIDTSLGFDAASDRANGVIGAWVQGAGAEKRIVTTSFDRPPNAFVGYTTQNPFRTGRLAWQPAFDLWGPIAYTVLLNGQSVGQTTDTRLQLPPTVVDGEYAWQVTAADRRGQTSRSRTRRLRLDRTPPVLTVRVSRRRGVARVRVFARDTPGAGAVGAVKAAGIRRVRVDWGDRTRVTTTTRQRSTLTHRYRGGRGSTLRVSATDRAGNATVVRRRVGG